MTAWSELHPIEFDSRLGTAKQRRVVREAPNTLFPRYLPDLEVAHEPADGPKPAELPGQGTLAGDDDEEEWWLS